jgi:hypothetical protein
MLLQSKNNRTKYLPRAISTKIASEVCIAIVLLTLFSMGLNSCTINGANTATETHSSTTPSTTLFTQWESKILVSDMAFQEGIAETINGKNYLFCSANYGASTQQQNTYVTIVILDISDPDHPNEISSVKTGQDEEPAWCTLKLVGTALYVLTDDNMWIINVSDPIQPKDMGQIPLIGASNIAISGKFAYIISYNISSNQTSGQIISTVDISDPVHPVNVGQITIPNTAFAGLEVSDSLLFALAYNGVYICDASIPSSLKQVGFLANPFPRTTGPIPTGYIPPNFFDMAIAENELYIVSGIDKLLAVNISNPAAPKIVSDLKMSEQSSEIVISGKDAYLLSSNDPIFGRLDILETVDISNPDKLKELKIMSLPGTLTESYNIMIEAGNHLYFCDNRYPIIQIIDLGNLADTLK